jgi:ABC-type transporter Mla subunit MlaD
MRWRGASRFFLTSVVIVGGSFAVCSRSWSEYQVVFTDALQLKRGSQVCYAGVPVGKVEAMSLRDSGSGGPSQVVVTIALKPGNYRVREGDRFQVLSAGLLGENYINIVPASPAGSPLSAGATIQGETPGSNVSSLKGFSNLLELMGIAVKLNNLPEAKREEVLKTLHRIVDEAVEAARPNNTRPTPRGKD